MLTRSLTQLLPPQICTAPVEAGVSMSEVTSSGRVKKVADDKGVHVFRHTYAMWVYKLSNYDLLVVKQALRHANVAVTERYVQSFGEHVREMADKLGKFFESLSPQLGVSELRDALHGGSKAL